MNELSIKFYSNLKIFSPQSQSINDDYLNCFALLAEGWHMTHEWLQDAIETLNWPLVQEILELFLLCPVDVNRLKSNNSPKLVKSLSKDGRSESKHISMR